MKWNDQDIERYAAGKLGPEESARLEKQLNQLLKKHLPEVPSQRLWKSIRARLEAEAPAPRGAQDGADAGLWVRLLHWISQPPSGGLRVALGAAAAMMLVALGLQVAMRQPEIPGEAVEEPKAAQAKGEAPASASAPAGDAAADAGKKEAAAGFAEEMPSAAPRSRPLARAEDAASRTEVERALAEQNLDAMIAAMLERQRELRQMSSGAGAGSGARSFAAAPQPSSVAYGESASARKSRMAPPAAAPSMSMAEEEGAYAAPAQAQPQGGLDANGFWDFSVAARAISARQWRQAEAEFERASQAAPEPSERAFAVSALRLLSLPGQPLEERVEDLDQAAGPLTVIRAGRWQYFASNRVALYSGGVAARMPGLRSEGQALQLDMNFDRASFSAGTRFTRIRGAEQPVSLEGGAAAPEGEFTAPRGADYLLKNAELRLK